MTAALTDEQRLLVETTRRFLQERAPVAAVRALFDDQIGFDRDVWRQGAELGWTAMLVPDQLGGMSVAGQGLVDCALVAGELGRAVHSGPFLPTNVVAFSLASWGNAEQHGLLDDILSGAHIAAWCMAGPAGVWSTDGVGPELSVESGSYILRGSACFVQDAAIADLFLVTARGVGGPTGVTQLLVPAGTKGVGVVPLTSLDLARRFADVRFDEVHLPRSAVLGEPGRADDAVERQLQVALVLQCAETVGVVDRVLEFTLEYAKDRIAFGRPIGSFQALKHRFADHAMWLEASKATAAYAARAVQIQDEDAELAVSVAKAHVGKAATTTVHDCVQIHGGIGMTWEHDLHLFVRRAVSNEVLYGTPRFHCQRLFERAQRETRRGLPQQEQQRGDQPRPGSTTGRSDITESDDTADEHDFRMRAREWIAANLPPLVLNGKSPLRWDAESVARDRLLQRALFDAGFAGITVPRDDGGQGLPPRFQQIFSEEAVGYRLPEAMGVAFNVVLPTVLTHASPAVRRRFVPPMLRGEEVWCQFLSEPSGGSDLAGLLTRATRDGDTWVINGQKVWTTGGNHSDYAVCLARTDPDVPKHAGLTMFAVPVRAKGVTVVPLRLLDGSVDFCQEYLDDVVIPADHIIGAVDEGWRVATTLMMNERAAVGRGWMLSKPGPSSDTTATTATSSIALEEDLVELARTQGRLEDPEVRALIGESWVIGAVQRQMVDRVSEAMRTGDLPGHAAAIPKLLSGVAGELQGELAVSVAGARAAAWPVGDETSAHAGMARVASHGIGGGTNEMQRNAIAERLLGLPREPASDRELPFNQLRHNAPRGVAGVDPLSN